MTAIEAAAAIGKRANDLLLADLRRPASAEAKEKLLTELVARGPLLPGNVAVMVTGYTQCRYVLNTPETFGTMGEAQRVRDLVAQAGRPSAQLASESVIQLSGEAHTHARAAMQRALVRRLSDMDRSWIGQELQKNIRKLWSDIERSTAADFVSVVAQPFAISLMARILGMPETDLTKLVPAVYMLGKMLDSISTGVAVKHYEPAMLEIRQALSHVLRSTNNHQGYSHQLLSEYQGYADVDQERILNETFAVMAPGLLNTIGALGNAAYALLRFPEQASHLSRNHSTIDDAITELMRLEPPVRGSYRVALTDCVVDDVAVSAGETIVVLTAAANRDPMRWPQPDALDITRGRAESTLTFGAGPHHCLGQSLPRLVLKHFLPAFCRDSHAYRVAEAPSREAGISISRLSHLWVAANRLTTGYQQ